MKFTLSFTLIAICSFLWAQQDTTYWQTGGVSSLTFSQVSLTNWAAGGQNSIAINGNFSVFANRTKGRGKWENSMDMFFGVLKQGNEGTFIKSDDQFNFVTKYSYKIKADNGKWFFTGLLDFKTQFADGFDTPEEENRISDFLAPAFLVVGLGASYDPNDKLSFSYQPISGKFTFVRDQELADQGAFGVDPAVFDDDGVTVITPGKNFRAEIGSFFRAKFKNEMFESKLELFTGYTENQGEIDVNWQNALVLQITKVLSLNAFTHMIYDKDIEIGNDDNNDGVISEDEIKPRLQFKSVLGVGLTYSFGAQRPE